MIGIMAMSENRCIGKNGKLPWHSKPDFQWFKEFTMGKDLLVGYNTFNTLPPLKNRRIWVVNFGVGDIQSQSINNILGAEGLIEKVQREYIKENRHWGTSNYILIGGKKTYELFMPHIAEFYVTLINGTYDGDTYMTEFEHLFSKNEVIREFEGGKVIKYYDRITGSHTIVGTPPPRCKICDAEIYNEPEEGFNYCSPY